MSLPIMDLVITIGFGEFGKFYLLKLELCSLLSRQCTLGCKLTVNRTFSLHTHTLVSSDWGSSPRTLLRCTLYDVQFINFLIHMLDKPYSYIRCTDKRLSTVYSVVVEIYKDLNEYYSNKMLYGVFVYDRLLDVYIDAQ